MPSTNEEQYLLELINDARMNPLGDAARYISGYAPLTSSSASIQYALTYFGVSGTQLLAAFQTLAPVTPLAWSDVLAGGARAHDLAMIAAATQSHQLPGEADFGSRLAIEDYAYWAAGENVYAYAQSVLYAHAGFMVDWGGDPTTGGMQSPPGHRSDILDAAYREVGVGVVDDADDGSGLGPEVVTEDFGTQGPSGAFVLGVAYADSDHDGFYSIGEGLAGLIVSVGGSSTISSSSGGYTLGTALTGWQTVVLTGGGLAGAVSVGLALSDAAGNGTNSKLDVVNGNTLELSASATVVGSVSVVQALGVQPLTIILGDAAGRTLIGNGGGDTLIGGGGNDSIFGGTGDDTIDGGAGSNVLDGGGGTNTVVFDFASTDATIAQSGGDWAVTALGTSDMVRNFTYYRFTDTTLSGLAPSMANALFDGGYYLAHNPDVAAAGLDPLQHYGSWGWHENRNPDGFFDTRFYLQQNPDVAAAGIDPLTHFELYGSKEGRAPSLLFDDAKYLAANPDVQAAGMDPLLHYLSYGASEGRPAFLTGGTAAADPLVDPGFYDPQLGATLIPAGPAAAQQAAWTYEMSGWQARLNPDAWFDTSYYLSHNPDVAASGLDPLLHYETWGWHEGRDPSAQFSTTKYLAAYTDVRAAGMDPLLHYVAYGESEGRPIFSA